METFYKTYTPIGALAFECALDCGTLVESDITSYHSTNYDSTLGDLRGNVYTFQNDAVLERFGFDFSYVDWPCEMEFFVLQHDPTTNTWPVIYQQHKRFEWFDYEHYTEFIGINVSAQETYALATGTIAMSTLRHKTWAM